MSISKFKIFQFSVLFLLISLSGNAQYVSTTIMSKHEAYKDSLRNVKYDYIFPVWGQKSYEKGFDIPYPAGIMGNYFWTRQGIVIDNFQLGLKTDEIDIPLKDVDFIDFGNNSNTSYSLNVRPDLWVFPFLNVYGIFGWGESHTEVNLTAPVEFTSIVDQSISTAGVGIMGAGGLGPVWFSADANWTWNKPELLDKPVRVNVLGLRLGHTFVFKHKPESNLALWVGGMRVKMSSESSGEIKLGDAIPVELMNEKGNELLDFYESLPPLDKLKPKYLLMKAIGERLVVADGEAIIRYGMDKQVKQKWNGLIGVQYQINKRWMLRSEAGLIGDRKSYLLSVNYRFLL